MLSWSSSSSLQTSGLFPLPSPRMCACRLACRCGNVKFRARLVVLVYVCVRASVSANRSLESGAFQDLPAGELCPCTDERRAANNQPKQDPFLHQLHQAKKPPVRPSVRLPTNLFQARPLSRSHVPRKTHHFLSRRGGISHRHFTHCERERERGGESVEEVPYPHMRQPELQLRARCVHASVRAVVVVVCSTDASTIKYASDCSAPAKNGLFFTKNPAKRSNSSFHSPFRSTFSGFPRRAPWQRSYRSQVVGRQHNHHHHHGKFCQFTWCSHSTTNTLSLALSLTLEAGGFVSRRSRRSIARQVHRGGSENTHTRTLGCFLRRGSTLFLHTHLWRRL